MKRLLCVFVVVGILAMVPYFVGAASLVVDDVKASTDSISISVRLLNDAGVGIVEQASWVGFRMLYNSNSLDVDVDSTFFTITDLRYEAGEVKFEGERLQTDAVVGGEIVVTFNVTLKDGASGEYVFILAPLDNTNPQVLGFGFPVQVIINMNLDPPFGELVDGAITFAESEPSNGGGAGGGSGGGGGGCFISSTIF